MKRIGLLLLMLLTFLMLSHAQAKLSLESNVGIWHLDEGRGDVAKDASKNMYNGQIEGGTWVDGKFGQALEFTKGDTVKIPLSKGTVRNQISIAMWINFTDLSDQQNYFSIYDQNDNRFVPYKDESEDNMLRCWSNTFEVGSGVTTEPNKWYHVANIYDGKKARIYIDGEEKVAEDVGAFELLDEDQTAWLATDARDWHSACIIDEVILFSRAITSDEVKDIYTNGINDAILSIPDPNLRAALEKALGKNEGDAITEEDLKGLEELYAGDKRISDIKGLEHCTSLTVLELDNNPQITDLSGLANLTSLTRLGLAWNQIIDLNVLANLTKLK